MLEKISHIANGQGSVENKCKYSQQIKQPLRKAESPKQAEAVPRATEWFLSTWLLIQMVQENSTFQAQVKLQGKEGTGRIFTYETFFSACNKQSDLYSMSYTKPQPVPA